MVLKIRLARVAGPGGSKRHAPLYNIVLAQARTARDSKPLEVLGTYDPIPKASVDAGPGARKHKDIQLDVSRAKYWLGVGAQPTDTAWRLLSMIGLLEPKYLPSGEQTENALKAVRFKTHLPKNGELQNILSNLERNIKPPRTLRQSSENLPNTWLSASSDEGPTSSMARQVRADTSKSATTMGETKGEVTGITSPQDPNAA